MHFFNMLHTLKSLLENIGAGNDVLEWEKKPTVTISPLTSTSFAFFGVEVI